MECRVEGACLQVNIAGTPIDCSCLIFSGISENDEVVAVVDFIDVGNILGKSWVGLLHNFEDRNIASQSRVHTNGRTDATKCIISLASRSIIRPMQSMQSEVDIST